MGNRKYINELSIKEIKDYFKKDYPNIEAIEIKRNYIILHLENGFTAQYPLDLVVNIRKEVK